MSSSKGKKRGSDSSSSSRSSSESDTSASSRDCRKRKHSDTSSDSENDKKSKVRKEQKRNPEDKSESKRERTDKYRRDHKEYKGVDYKKTHRENDCRSFGRRADNGQHRRSHERDDRRRNENRSDHHRRNNDRQERSGRYERDRNDSGGRRRSLARFKGNRERRSRSKSFDHANAKWGKDSKDSKESKGEKQKANFGLSGKLTEETNTYKGVVIKYSEPPEARKPKRRWRLYPFKGEKALQTLYIHRESGYLIGRDRKVVDLAVDHPSCSKQHAAIQYRLVPFTRDDGSAGKRVRPYIIDLESANGTFINNKKIEPKKYVELLEKDVIKFGFSSREYVLLHENSKDDALDDDVKVEEEEDVKIKKEKQDI